MSAGAIVAIIVAVALVVLVIGMITATRRRQLRRRFGPEYDRVAGEMRSQRKADAELAERERRVRGLDIHPLDKTIRVKYAGEWTAIQERFVDQPEEAVTQAGMLVTSVMKDRGYPTEDHDQILADLSVEPPARWTTTVRRTRSACRPRPATSAPRTCGWRCCSTGRCSATCSASRPGPQPAAPAPRSRMSG